MESPGLCMNNGIMSGVDGWGVCVWGAGVQILEYKTGSKARLKKKNSITYHYIRIYLALANFTNQLWTKVCHITHTHQVLRFWHYECVYIICRIKTVDFELCFLIWSDWLCITCRKLKIQEVNMCKWLCVWGQTSLCSVIVLLHQSTGSVVSVSNLAVMLWEDHIFASKPLLSVAGAWLSLSGVCAHS